MAKIEILAGSYPKQHSIYANDCLPIMTHDKGRITYWMKEATVSIQKLAERTDGVHAKLTLRDDSQIEVILSVNDFEQIRSYAGAGNGFNYISECKTPSDVRKERIGCLAVLASFVLIAFTVLLFFLPPAEKNFGSTKKKFDLEDEKLNATIRCRMLVSHYLTSPDSAKYPVDYDNRMSVSDDLKVFTLNSYVSAENAFGVRVRTPFMCKVLYTGGGQEGWELIDFQIYD